MKFNVTLMANLAITTLIFEGGNAPNKGLNPGEARIFRSHFDSTKIMAKNV